MICKIFTKKPGDSVILLLHQQQERMITFRVQTFFQPYHKHFDEKEELRYGSTGYKDFIDFR